MRLFTCSYNNYHEVLQIRAECHAQAAAKFAKWLGLSDEYISVSSNGDRRRYMSRVKVQRNYYVEKVKVNQCWATTKKGKRCLRAVSEDCFDGKYCHPHFHISVVRDIEDYKEDDNGK